jgi:DNA-binding CsgD family transcriptional regulator
MAVHLTPQQRTALVLVAGGHTNDDAGTVMGIAGSTIATHLNRAYATLGARNAAHAVDLAWRHGLLGGDTAEKQLAQAQETMRRAVELLDETRTALTGGAA